MTIALSDRKSLQDTSRPVIQTRVRGLYVASIVMLFFAWEGLFSRLIGQEVYLHRQLISGAILGLAGLRVLQAILMGRMGRFEIYSICLYLLCLAVSYISNTWIFPQDWSFWVLSTYSVAPCLLLLALRLLGFRGEELLAGLVTTGVLASLIVVADQVFQFWFMDYFERGQSAGIERRVVFLKTESAFALVVLGMRLLAARQMKHVINYGMLSLVTAINLVVVTESRLALAAVAISVLLTVLFSMRGVLRARALILTALGVAVLGQAVFGKYIEQAFSYGDYVAEDVSVNWRVRTIAYFYEYFERTGGLGYGLMSAGPEAGNFLSWANNYAGIYAGIGRYPMHMADTGIIGALMQFGYLGLAAVVAMTLAMAWRLMKAGFRKDHEMFALGALVLGYMLSPLPMNFFTLEWSTMTGNLIWSIAAFTPAMVAAKAAGALGAKAETS